MDPTTPPKVPQTMVPPMARCSDSVEPPTPTSMLKAQMHVDLQNIRSGHLDKLFCDNGDLQDGFALLREMENWEDDEFGSMKDWDNLEDQQEELLDGEKDKMEEEELQELYDAEFPKLQNQVNSAKEKWGPVQATRMSTRHAGDIRTIMRKAQQLKEVLNMEIPKPQGTKTKPDSNFSNFNDPSFISIASRIGVDITLDVAETTDRNICKTPDQKGSDKTMGLASEPPTLHRCEETPQNLF